MKLLLGLFTSLAIITTAFAGGISSGGDEGLIPQRVLICSNPKIQDAQLSARFRWIDNKIFVSLDVPTGENSVFDVRDGECLPIAESEEPAYDCKVLGYEMYLYSPGSTQLFLNIRNSSGHQENVDPIPCR